MSRPTGSETTEPLPSLVPHPRSARSMRSMRRVSLLLVLLLGLWTGCGGTGDSGDGSDADSTGTASESAAGSDSPGESSSDESGDDGEDSGDSEDSDDKDGEDKPRKEKTTSVQAATVTRGNLVIPVVAEGRIRARKTAEIRSEISGRVDRILVQEGSRVGRGQVLARLDGREYEVAIAESRSRYLESLSRILVEEERRESDGAGGDTIAALEEELVDLWEQERLGKMSRDERLARERAIEIAALENGAFRQRLVDARTGLAGAKADEERARLNLERTEIRAPFAGVVSNLTLQPGERITTGDPICNLVDNVDVEAEVGVLESDLRGLVVGRPALLMIPALAETLQASVDVIAPEIDPDTRTCRVLLRYRSEDGRVRPGMFVRASIAGQTFEDRILVPREAILMRDERPLVFKVEDGRAKWVYVTTGMQNDRVVEISGVIQGGPLDPGTKVIVTDHLTLTENAKVKVTKTRGLGDPWALASRTDS